MGDISLCRLLLNSKADPERQSLAGAKAKDRENFVKPARKGGILTINECK